MIQWVCKKCGYNIIGEQVDICPFCGATHDQFISWKQAEKIYRVCSHQITDRVTQLVAEPKPGLNQEQYYEPEYRQNLCLL